MLTPSALCRGVPPAMAKTSPWKNSCLTACSRSHARYSAAVSWERSATRPIRTTYHALAEIEAAAPRCGWSRLHVRAALADTVLAGDHERARRLAEELRTPHRRDAGQRRTE